MVSIALIHLWDLWVEPHWNHGQYSQLTGITWYHYTNSRTMIPMENSEVVGLVGLVGLSEDTLSVHIFTCQKKKPHVGKTILNHPPYHHK